MKCQQVLNITFAYCTDRCSNRLNIEPKDVPGDELYSDDLADLCQEWQTFCFVTKGQEDRGAMRREGPDSIEKITLVLD